MKTTDGFDELLPIAEIAKRVNSGTMSAVKNVEDALRRIKSVNDKYNVVLSTLESRAREKAQHIDAQVSGGKNCGRLAGVTFIAKDNFLVFGSDTTAGSTMLKGFDAPYQSTAVDKLESEGAICVGKANLDAFGHGGSTENSDYCVTKNPYDTTRVAGGSSGGSAAAVSLGLVSFSLGTDTGGSIRQPASFCGVIGYKPTYGLVSRSGVVAMASSTDCIGAFARSAEDIAEVLEVMSGKDALDGTTIDDLGMPLNKLDPSIKGKKIGIVTEYLGDGVQPEVVELVTKAAEDLRKQGAIVEEVSLPSLPLALAIYYIVVPAELSSNLARHDGQRYRYSAYDESESLSLDEAYEASRSRGFGAEAKRRIMIGTHVLSSGYYDAYYKKAQTVRTKLINEFKKAFEEFDFLIGPVSPTPAFSIGQNSDDPLQMYLQDIMTVAASLVGIPSVSVPCGFVGNLPVGVQIMAPQRADRELLSVVKSYEDMKK